MQSYTSDPELDQLKTRVKNLFYHAYDGYMKYAFPFDELRPLTCDGHDTWGSFSLTLVDALDTLAIIGNWTEFNHASQLLLDNLNVDRDVNVSVFETNIRVVGGLLSAHLLSRRAGFYVEPSWPCSGPLLRQAELFASKILPAFDTLTGMPYGTVNLALGAVPFNETTVSSVAGVGTFIIEFGTLSRLTGDPRYETAALRALRALWEQRSSINLLGNHIDVMTGKWVATEATIGGSVDSLFEYLVKGAALFRLPELDAMFREYKQSIETHLKRGDWYLVVNKDNAQVTRPTFQGLEAFWPSILSLTGDLDNAIRHLTAYHEVWKQYGFIPETYNVISGEIASKRESYHLRPEFIESVYYLYRATKDPMFIRMGVDVLTSIESVTRTSCGYATVSDVTSHKLANRMESFFLSETTKYLYLLFDENNFLNELPGDGSPSQHYVSPSGGFCSPEMGGYIFNTEAHPIDPGSINCCHLSNGLERLDKSNIFAPNTAEPFVPAEDIEALKLLEERMSPLTDLFTLIDSAQAQLPTDTVSPALHKYYSLLDETDMEPWTDLDSMTKSSQGLHRNHTSTSAAFDDLDSIQPPLLTCPYPPFHHRYTFSGQMVIPVG